jgi:Abi-like protein
VNFAYTPDRLIAIERSLSTERLSYYVEKCDGDLETAIRMYQLNTKLASNFYIPLQGIEIAVRNEINGQLRAQFGEDWHDLSTIRLEPRHQDDVRSAVREATEIADDGTEVLPTNGQVVAALRFGFWVGILGPRNENEIWRKALYKGFPHRSRGQQRKVVHGVLNQIRQLRNLVAHHRRILHRDLVSDHDSILEVASWVCPHVHEWIKAHSLFDPADLPVPQRYLPNIGMPEVDPLPPATPQLDSLPTLGGRARLSVTSGRPG